MAKRKASVTKVFVPNRGEIAVRIIRACRELGIPVVAGYSEPDVSSLHVRLADEAVLLGPAAPRESYLNVDAILKAIEVSGCDAVHPGYGFLSENADFAEALEKAGVTFIGPSAKVIRSMGSKLESRRLMRDAGVPIVPGTVEGSDKVTDIVKAAKDVDGPIFLKASAGGGGKGMRLVTDRKDIEAAAKAAVGEAQSAFGDGTVYIEKQVQRPRHIEFQVLADGAGNTVHLFERECSIQRRHQKLLEETPSIALDDDLRQRMGDAAVTAAKAVGYASAGTIEFMLDQSGEFYFLEMNTRIQVEHPITECTTGIDLVKWQLRIAAGETLSFKQEDIRPRGHAIECRVYAEDPAHNFAPSAGVIEHLHEPWGPGVRNDSGVYEGYEVSPFYDPIVSKLVTYAEDRESARRRMLGALAEYVVHGIETTIPVHQRILEDDAFIKGETYTDYLDQYIDGWFSGEVEVPDEVLIAAALSETLSKPAATGTAERRQDSAWTTLGRWQIGGDA